MLVRLKTGNYAGSIVDLPKEIAEIELQFGTAELIEAIAPPTIPEIKIPNPKETECS